MYKKLIILIVIIGSFGNLETSAQFDTYELMKKGFENPIGQARPKVYWWCLNGNIDTVRAKEELLAMKNNGIGGFDLFEIGVPAGDTMIPGGPAFMSDESLKIIKFVIEEAGKLELTVGLNLASSWNAGGSWIKPQNGGKSLYFSKIIVKGNSSFQNIKVPFPDVSFPKASLVGGTDKPMIPFNDNGKPVYYEEVSILAMPYGIAKNNLDTSKIINVTRFFDSDNDMLNWNIPPGEWEILRYICSNSGQQLVLPSPNSAGLSIDHFDSTAVSTHLNYIIGRLKPVLGDFRNTALKSFYLASYEARGFVWTSTLPAEFNKINGYDIYKFLPLFFNTELFSSATTNRVKADFKKTLSELMITNLYKKAKEICNANGLKINCEAGGPGYPLYNGPSEPLKALGALDIPRGEFWVDHSVYYPDGKDSIDILRVVKEVSAASHIYQKGIVEEEAFTSFRHWQEGPFDIKHFGDRAFCEGMNRAVFHGFSHNPAGTGFPGIVYHAGTHFNDKRVWWTKVKPFVDYLSRASYIFQEAKFVSDVLYYYGDRIPNSATPKNTHFTAGPGFDYEVINTEILLNDLKVQDGKLILSNGSLFRILALENEDEINPEVLTRLNELVQHGAVIIGNRPKKIGAQKNKPFPADREEFLLNHLWTDVVDISKDLVDNKNKIYSGINSQDMLKALDVLPDLNYSDKESYLLDFIHYQKSDIDFYFIANTTNQWISRNCGFRQQSKTPEIWNPLTGEVIPVSIYNQESNYISVPVTLPPYGSCFVVFRAKAPSVHYNNVFSKGQNPPLLEFTRDGILFMNDESISLTGDEGSRQAKNNQEIKVIDGPWKVRFSKGWGAPDSSEFAELSSWADNKNPGIRYYSGTGTYTKTFYYGNNPSLLKNKKIYIDLGNVCELAELWLNGFRLGITWAQPFRYDVTGFIKKGENVLAVEVANTWSNRLSGDAITGQKFTNTNIVGMDRLPWSRVPLLESGLIGPVTIKTVSLVQ